jgi:hypothetical protein
MIDASKETIESDPQEPKYSGIRTARVAYLYHAKVEFREREIILVWPTEDRCIKRNHRIRPTGPFICRIVNRSSIKLSYSRDVAKM